MESEEIISDTEPLLTRGHVPTDSRSSITDHEPSAPREGAEGGKKTSEPTATYAPVTARDPDGEDLKIRIASSVQQARHLLQQVKQEPESVATSQGGGNAATRGRTADHVLRQQQLGRQPAFARDQRNAAAGGQMAAGYGSMGPPQYQPKASNQSTAQGSTARVLLVAFPTTQQPRAFQQREVWRTQGGGIVPQPEPGRIVISGSRDRASGTVSYTYAEDLPCCIRMCTVLAIILLIISTPLSLVISIPAVMCMWKAHEEVGKGNVQAARTSYKFSLILMVLAVSFGLILTTVVITLGVVYGLHDNN